MDNLSRVREVLPSSVLAHCGRFPSRVHRKVQDRERVSLPHAELICLLLAIVGDNWRKTISLSRKLFVFFIQSVFNLLKRFATDRPKSYLVKLRL